MALIPPVFVHSAGPSPLSRGCACHVRRLSQHHCYHVTTFSFTCRLALPGCVYLFNGQVSNPLLLPLVAALSAAAIELLRAPLLSLCNFFNFSLQELGLEEVIDMHDDVRQDPAFKRLTLQQRQASDVKLGRDGCRVPLPWTPSGSSMGFGPDGGCSPWLPQPQQWSRLSVAVQESSDDSTLAVVRRAITTRRGCLPLLQGEFCWLDDVGSTWSPAGGDHVDSVFFSPLVSVGRAISGVVSIGSAVLNGLKRLIPLDADSNVLAFERRHAAGRVVCVFNMVRSRARPRPSLCFYHPADDMAEQL